MGEKKSDVLGQRLSDKDVLCHLSACLDFSKDIPVVQECLMAVLNVSVFHFTRFYF